MIIILRTDITGTKALGNGNEGVKIEEGASHNFIGTGNFRDRNLISGNTDDGVTATNLETGDTSEFSSALFVG